MEDEDTRETSSTESDESLELCHLFLNFAYKIEIKPVF